MTELWAALDASGFSATVQYSDPDFGRAAPLGNTDLVLIGCPDGQFVEARWDDEDGQYVVTLFRKQFTVVTDSRTFDTPEDAVQAVKSMTERAYRLSRGE